MAYSKGLWLFQTIFKKSLNFFGFFFLCEEFSYGDEREFAIGSMSYEKKVKKTAIPMKNMHFFN